MTSIAFDDQFLPNPDDVAQASAEGAGGDWRIDHSAGRPILVYQNCSVIEAEQAEYVLRLIEADRQQRGRDEITPDMLVAAQKYSELGAWVCGHWTGAYGCIEELYRVMRRAALSATKGESK